MIRTSIQGGVQMEKRFLEVFSTLQLNTVLSGIWSDVSVKKVTMNREKNRLRIYIESQHLIPKQAIFQTEDAIWEQVFCKANIVIKIIEKFCLSSQYTPKSLLEVYKDSILLELKNYNTIEFSIFRKAKCQFMEEDILQLTVEDSIVAQDKTKELKQILEKIFVERCGVPLEIRFLYEQSNTEKKQLLEEQRVEQEVAQILKNSALGAKILGEKSQDNSLQRTSLNTPPVSKKKDLSFGMNPPIEGTADAALLSQEIKEQKVPYSDNLKNKNISENKNSLNNGRNHFGNYNGGTGNYSEERRENNRYKSAKGIKRSDNPDVLYGRDFEDESIPIEQIQSEMGEVAIRGQIIASDSRPIRGEKTILIFDVTDFTDTITVKMFTRNEQLPEILPAVTKGSFIKIKGLTSIDKFDGELTIASVIGIKKCPAFLTPRMDHAVKKRVELHCHTKMSDMDGVADAAEVLKQAAAWGHSAVAITDHGVVQSFTEALHALDKMKSDLKVLYGVEGYLVDDLKEIVENSKNQSLAETYVVFDIETTGFSPTNHQIIEIGAVKVKNGVITEKFSEFVNPHVPIPFEIEKLTGIRDDMVLKAEGIETVLPKFLAFSKDAVMVAHNAAFDMSFIYANAKRIGISLKKTVVDTVGLARILLPSLNKFKLDNVAKALNVSLENHHRAVDDAGATAEIFVKFVRMLKDREVETLDGVNELSKVTAENIKKLPSHHVIILAKNDIGRINLYRLVSYSHLYYFSRQPRIPKSLLNQYREGLIIGSACEAGELYQAVLRGASEEEIARLVHFYDYLEIQPLENNEFMLRGENPIVKSEEELKEINRKIVALGEQYQKLVVATCDVHFLNPEDEVYRRVVMAARMFKDADNQAPLYFRTTEEMLEEFSYLGAEKAEEVVITNTNKIADMCERISPVRPDKCAPVIEDSDKTLRKICYDKAYEVYGQNLPEVVTERLERELNSIISNGFAVMYIIAQKLVWKSNEDGYLVGSRGSVGSSFVAAMAGITEVNSLSPHYYCSNCHFSDFDSPQVKAFAGGSGCDMPDRCCPNCGEKLQKEGFDIPFETFLGFKGNKEPDIDLNFSGEYQSKAHDYTEVIFGKGQTFRAGTIGTMAEKTAYGYAKKYYEERGNAKRKCEINRIVQGCVGIRRTTGQHPGGIIVLPIGEEIYSFTPVQHPANDMTTPTITTHFDYHSIDHNLLKLDILGHDDPTMIRMLEDLTGLDAKKIPLDSKEVMSLFMNTSALGITPEEIGGCKLGALGIPEFGTDFAMQMVIDAKPTCFADLIRISGLSHGTDVWLGNAQTLIEEGKATISTAICTRDDIMIYLINQGMEKELSFTIMESVRKGKGLKPEWEEQMLAHGVPDWYIWSCKKIKYMFPKAHAAAYVMMAWRIAYCKVFYPLAYYAAFFSIRASGFSYEMMCQGREKLEYFLADYRRRADTLSNREQDTMRDLRIVQEMYARGYEFTPIDVYTAQAARFQIVDGKIMPSLSSIDGLGDRAAYAVVEAAKDGVFLSKEDFWQRTKVSKGVIDLMVDMGILNDLPESNQLSLFDL